MTTRTVYHTSVRTLVEFILRSGDIDHRISQTDSLKAMQEGSRIHKQLQEASGPSYHAEVALSLTRCFENYDLVLDGRADGIIEEDCVRADGKYIRSAANTGGKCAGPDENRKDASDPADIFVLPETASPAEKKTGVTIDEIKTTSMRLEQLTEPVPVHLAQAKCYAYIYALQNDLTRIGVQITYAYVEPEQRKKTRRRKRDPETDLLKMQESPPETIRRFYSDYAFEALEEWFEALIREYRRWLDYLWQWKQLRTQSIRELAFPFPYRDGQKDLAAGVYRTIVHQKTLFLQAPTGTGKTMAVLYPSVKALGEGHADRIFYLTAKTETRQAAVDAFSILQTRGLRMKYVLLTAKEKMCLCDEMICDPDHCPYAKGHFDRVNDAVYEMLCREESFGRRTIRKAAQTYGVCPFELSLDLTDWTDAVIGDYNYVLDPLVRLKRYFADGKRGPYLFLVDEAHNLPDRAREMYSAKLVKEEFLKVRRILKQVDKRADKLLNAANQSLLERKREMEEGVLRQKARYAHMQSSEGSYAVCTSTGTLDLTLMRLQSVLDELLREHREFADRDAVQELYFRISRFLMIQDLADENYIMYSQTAPDGTFELKLLCVNPAQNLQNCFDSGVSAILFSATLLPVRYYINLLSKEENPYTMYARSSFPAEHKCLLIARDVSSRYTRRSEGEFRRVAEYLRIMAGAKAGNYMAFFPSYKVMEEVHAQFEVLAQEHEEKPVTEVIVQKSHMTPDEREDFLRAFSRPHDAGLVAFCVTGGIFSEGIDLREEQLIGVAVYGTGLPQMDAELCLIRDYYDRHGLDGFAYACQYPGMNKVQQAAGRVIRTAADRGVILLLDERFLRSDYRKLFPREWADYIVTDIGQVKEQIENFWFKEQ